MKFKEILEMWKEDNQIDQTEIGDEIEKTYSLHCKYYDLLHTAKLTLKSYEYELKRKRVEAFEDYTQGPPKGSSRQPPAVGRILRADSGMYLDADEQLQELSAKIDAEQLKVDFLKDVLDQIKYRNNSLKSVLDWIKYTGGA